MSSAQRLQKQDKVSSVKQVYESADYVFLFSYKGSNAKFDVNLRRDIKSTNSTVKIVKNTLNKLALQGTKFADVAPHLQGQLATVFTQDPVGVAKILEKACAEDSKCDFVLYSNGSSVNAKASDLVALAKVPSLDASRAQLLGLLTTVPSRILSSLQYHTAGVVRAIDAKAKKG